MSRKYQKYINLLAHMKVSLLQLDQQVIITSSTIKLSTFTSFQ